MEKQAQALTDRHNVGAKVVVIDYNLLINRQGTQGSYDDIAHCQEMEKALEGLDICMLINN